MWSLDGIGGKRGWQLKIRLFGSFFPVRHLPDSAFGHYVVCRWQKRLKIKFQKLYSYLLFFFFTFSQKQRPVTRKGSYFNHYPIYVFLIQGFFFSKTNTQTKLTYLTMLLATVWSADGGGASRWNFSTSYILLTTLKETETNLLVRGPHHNHIHFHYPICVFLIGIFSFFETDRTSRHTWRRFCVAADRWDRWRC